MSSPSPAGPRANGPGSSGLARLGPRQQLAAGRMGRRLAQLMIGLVLFGISLAMVLRGSFGVEPWGVFHLGLINHLPLSYGTMSIVVSAVVLLAWWPLRQWPGVGTVLNAVVVGLAIDATLWAFPQPEALVARVLLLLGGVVLNGLAAGLYIGSQLGPGPRDGLMTGLADRTGLSIRTVRTAIEVTVLLAGVALGGQVGLGTVVYALGIGPLVHLFLPRCIVQLDRARVDHLQAG